MRYEDDEFDADSDADDTIFCPHCGESIHEDSQRCPHCENYISLEDGTPKRKAPWFVIGILALLLIVALGLLC
jgi:predicted nucleic acid-binding Zn ribbon protein